ncbi:HNH endonuclease [Comamonas sp. SY3]|uniref:HNH endonuclease n=1 Tax=Comamonas sp. SY3 TaxID=3243601 RepID=UPI003593D0DF
MGLKTLKPRPSSSVTRITGRRLQRIRERHFDSYPLCVMCEKSGRVRLATELDHIIALVNGGLDFDRDRGCNRQGLCLDCHEDKTRSDLRQRPKTQIGSDGWPVDASPHQRVDIDRTTFRETGAGAPKVHTPPDGNRPVPSQDLNVQKKGK